METYMHIRILYQLHSSNSTKKYMIDMRVCNKTICEQSKRLKYVCYHIMHTNLSHIHGNLKAFKTSRWYLYHVESQPFSIHYIKYVFHGLVFSFVSKNFPKIWVMIRAFDCGFIMHNCSILIRARLERNFK